MPKVKTTTNGGIPARIDKLIAHKLALRKRIEEIKDEQKKYLSKFEEASKKLDGALLEWLDSTGQEAARTEEGTVYISNKSYASLADPDAFMNYVMENGAFELMDRRANATACRDYAEENGELPPGVKLNNVRSVGVRSPT